MSKQDLTEKFARTQRVDEKNVSMVGVQFRREGGDTEVIVGNPVNKRTTIKGYTLQDAIAGPGQSFLLEQFENAVGRPIANGGRGWIAAMQKPDTAQPDTVINATYLIAAEPQRFLSHNRRY